MTIRNPANFVDGDNTKSKIVMPMLCQVAQFTQRFIQNETFSKQKHFNLGFKPPSLSKILAARLGGTLHDSVIPKLENSFEIESIKIFIRRFDFCGAWNCI